MHTLRIHAKLTKDGEKDIDLVVQSHWLEQASPCYVAVDGATRLVGGNVGSLEEVFHETVDKHPGYIVQGAEKLIANVAG